VVQIYSRFDQASAWQCKRIMINAVDLAGVV
jgi:hypothetical protein